VLPPDAALVVTADHGQVDVGDRIIAPHADVLAHVSFQSGEGRFRWLHARPGREQALLDAAAAHHADVAWVVTRDQTIDEGWWGPKVSDDARHRLGDVALVAREPVSFDDPADTGPFELIGRHGSHDQRRDARPPARRRSPMTDPRRRRRAASPRRARWPPAGELVARGELVAHGGDRGRADAEARSGARRWRSRPRSCGSAP
jgi:hypothetical protein